MFKPNKQIVIAIVSTALFFGILGATALCGYFYYKQAKLIGQHEVAIQQIVQYLNTNLPPKDVKK